MLSKFTKHVGSVSGSKYTQLLWKPYARFHFYVFLTNYYLSYYFHLPINIFDFFLFTYFFTFRYVLLLHYYYLPFIIYLPIIIYLVIIVFLVLLLTN